MNPLRTLAALLLPLCAHAAVPLDWIADVSKPSVAPLACRRGETAALRCTLVRDGRSFNPAAVSAAIYWQTNGMGDLWWSAPATVASNVLTATWTPAMDPGASPVSIFIGAADASGDRIYSPAASLRILHAPGALPNELPLPVRAIDFATVSVANAPWALASDVQRPVAPSTDPSAAGKPADAKATGEALAGKASTADATLVPQQYSSWIVVAQGTTTTITLEWGNADGITGWIPKHYGSDAGIAKGGESSTSLSWSSSSSPPEAAFNITAKRSITAWQLGSQSDKPLAPAGDYALKSELSPVKAVKRNGTALTPDAQGAVNVEVPTVPTLPLSVANGGTGAITAAAARENLGAMSATADGNTILTGGTDWDRAPIGVFADLITARVGARAPLDSLAARYSDSGSYEAGDVVWDGENIYVCTASTPSPAGPFDLRFWNLVDVASLLGQKQNTISDLATIRSGAAAGATAVQPSGLANYVQKSQTAGLLKNDGTVDTNTYLTAHQELRYRIATRTPTVSGTTASATLDDRAINTVQVAAGVTTLNLTFPAATSGYARDFFVRVVTAGTDLATVAMTADGAAADIEIGLDDLTDWNKAGTHLVLFTEIAPGKWLASKRFKEATP